ncbi:hypothetical protein EBAPG3_006395 [Nitrosospira lacus]|uniref:Uncharacterized protein n=1 Tax=Nitrosospira lacus TaxID=1288494 RepID=A0A1W6SNQ3_9PROT|nr:hypothetical protein EBAPG3_006395 [Nitrosospira lacus]
MFHELTRVLAGFSFRMEILFNGRMNKYAFSKNLLAKQKLCAITKRIYETSGLKGSSASR